MFFLFLRTAGPLGPGKPMFPGWPLGPVGPGGPPRPSCPAGPWSRKQRVQNENRRYVFNAKNEFNWSKN